MIHACVLIIITNESGHSDNRVELRSDPSAARVTPTFGSDKQPAIHNELAQQHKNEFHKELQSLHHATQHVKYRYLAPLYSIANADQPPLP